jgi:hypothetical protein
MKLKIFSHFYSSLARAVSRMEDESFYEAPEAVSPGFSIVLGIVVFAIVLFSSITGPFRRWRRG